MAQRASTQVRGEHLILPTGNIQAGYYSLGSTANSSVRHMPSDSRSNIPIYRPELNREIMLVEIQIFVAD